MNEVRVSDWSELQEVLYESSWQEEISRFRSRFAFRGIADASMTLRTGLNAGGFERHEQHMLRNFRKYAGRDSVPGDSIWNWLALAQHHGLPTRLLDWTFSPYVALHFMTRRLRQFDVDGAIWCVDYTRTNDLLPPPLLAVLEEEGSHVFTAEMLDRVARTLPELDAIFREDYVIFLEPPSFDDRIVNQFALFSLMSSSSSALDRWLDDKPGAARRIVVPASLKWEVRDKLDQANVTERVLFPGLDGLTAWLRRYYYDRSAARSDQEE